MDKVENEGKKENKKVISKVLIAIIAAYIVFCLFKFTLLLICYIRANNIADYKNYEISIGSSINSELENEVLEFSESYIYRNGVQQIENYDFKNNFAQQITYINQKEDKAYILNYDEELKKYVYEDIKDYEDFSYE